MSVLLKKLRHKYIWERVLVERLTEPLHLNIFSLFVAIFGRFRAKVAFDLALRCQHAYAMLKCADEAKALGYHSAAAMEFGVAAGAGLLNIAHVGKRVTRATGIEFKIYGFDTGKGMPRPESYKDHPDLYQEGDYKMDSERLRKILPDNVELILGDVAETLPTVLDKLDPRVPIGFVSIDLDYYSSTKQALASIGKISANKLLPHTLMYFDDLESPSHNNYCGELLAINEFNQEHEYRKIEKHPFLRGYRIFKNARWIDHMFTMHVLDHSQRNTLVLGRETVDLTNPYLS